jgi:hypothetical protein
MKYLKMLGLAAIAALALTAVVGAGSAAANAKLCKKAISPCPAGEAYPAGTKISASLKTKTHAQLTTSLGTITCTKSAVAGETTQESGNPLHGVITAVSFEGCTLASTACTVTPQNLPYTATGTAGATVGNGTLTVERSRTKTENGTIDEGGRPQAAVQCGVLINCTFGSGDISFAVTGGAPAQGAVNQSLEREGGLCPSTSTWEAEYTVTSPSPLFIVTN